MSIQSAVLFDPQRKATPIFLALLKSKGAVLPLQATEPLIDADLTESDYFDAWWTKAFPNKRDLFGPIANADGTGTAYFWRVFT